MDDEPVSVKRLRVDFDLTPSSTSTEHRQSATAVGSKLHSLDSDEEDDGAADDKYNVFDPEDIEGEEDDTIRRDGDIKLTPFNMKEEMNEGHFDADGNYFWKKEVNVSDAWLDHMEELPIPESGDCGDNGGRLSKCGDSDASDQSDSDDEQQSSQTRMSHAHRLDLFRHMLSVMRPAESVIKCLRRLGGNRTSASARWARKKANNNKNSDSQHKQQECPPGGSGDAASDVTQLESLTGWADQLLAAGNMEVYQLTYEALQHQLSEGSGCSVKSSDGGEHTAATTPPSSSSSPLASSRSTSQPSVQPTSIAGDHCAHNDEHVLDMFGEDLDKSTPAGTRDASSRELETSSTTSATTGSHSEDDTQQPNKKRRMEQECDVLEETQKSDGGDVEEGGGVMWHLRWSPDVDAQLHGPFSCRQMADWAASGYFDSGQQAEARRVGTERFYNVSRIDFELYVD